MDVRKVVVAAVLVAVIIVVLVSVVTRDVTSDGDGNFVGDSGMEAVVDLKEFDVVPKDGVVHVTSSVEFDRLLNADEACIVPFLFQVSLLFEEPVEVFHVLGSVKGSKEEQRRRRF